MSKRGPALRDMTESQKKTQYTEGVGGFLKRTTEKEKPRQTEEKRLPGRLWGNGTELLVRTISHLEESNTVATFVVGWYQPGVGEKSGKQKKTRPGKRKNWPGGRCCSEQVGSKIPRTDGIEGRRRR